MFINLIKEKTMRRDYFICTFLLCICVSLFYVLFSPLYFVYGHIVVRDFGIMETIFAWIYFLFVFGVLPVYSAYTKKLWITAGLASYSFFCACLPAWILPSMSASIGGTESNIFAVVTGFCLKSVYEMAEAPFAPLTMVFGDKFSESLSRKILFEVLFIYCVVQIYRFYRDAYLAEKLNPANAIDRTANEHKAKEHQNVRKAVKTPEVIGTVISAPAKPAPAPDSSPKPAPVPVPPVKAPRPVQNSVQAGKPAPAPKPAQAGKPVQAPRHPSAPRPAPAAAQQHVPQHPKGAPGHQQQ